MSGRGRGAAGCVQGTRVLTDVTVVTENRDMYQLPVHKISGTKTFESNIDSIWKQPTLNYNKIHRYHLLCLSPYWMLSTEPLKEILLLSMLIQFLLILEVVAERVTSPSRIYKPNISINLRPKTQVFLS